MKTKMSKGSKEENLRLRFERDILRELAVEAIQEKEKITREQAELKVSRQIFNKFNGGKSVVFLAMIIPLFALALSMKTWANTVQSGSNPVPQNSDFGNTWDESDEAIPDQAGIQPDDK